MARLGGNDNGLCCLLGSFCKLCITGLCGNMGYLLKLCVFWLALLGYETDELETTDDAMAVKG